MRTNWPQLCARSLLFCATLLGCVSLHAHPSSPDGAPTVDWGAVELKLQRWIDAGYYSHASIAVGRHGSVIFQQSAGTMPSSQIEDGGELGNWMAAATIARLVDAGKLSWNTPVSKYMPDAARSLRDLSLRELLSQSQEAACTCTRQKDILAESGMRAHVEPPPGMAVHECSQRVELAEVMAERATGIDWPTLFLSTLAKPLGLRHSQFHAGAKPVFLSNRIDTTPADYLRFLEMVEGEGVLDGRRLLSTQSVRVIEADRMLDSSAFHGFSVEPVCAAGRGSVYGLDLRAQQTGAAHREALLSAVSASGAYAWIDRSTGVYGVFLGRANREKAAQDGFDPLFSSPVFALLVCDALRDAERAGVQHGYINVEDGGRLYYEQAGEGTPVIFIHGHSFDHFEWDPQFYAMRKQYRVIRYDVRGYGRSSLPKEFSSTLHARDTIALMDALHIRKAHIVGLSMGGIIATDLLALYPDRLLSVTAASGDIFPGSPGPSTPWSTDGITKRRKEIAQFKANGIAAFKLQWLNALTVRNGRVLDNIRTPIWEMIERWDAWQPMHVEPRYLLGLSVLNMLQGKKISVPVMVLTGDVDAGRPDRLMQLVPSARQVIVSHAGHVSNLENADEFTSDIIEFIRNSEQRQK